MGRKGLGEFENIVISAVLRLGDNAYGMTIRREIEERTDESVSIAAVYTTLERLEKKGMVSSRVGETTTSRKGQPKKYFRVEAAGAHALNASRERLTKMWGGTIPGAAGA
jgi:DNA-binding PadR family transcriptional regulator